jgi:hypothetical protein
MRTTKQKRHDAIDLCLHDGGHIVRWGKMPRVLVRPVHGQLNALLGHRDLASTTRYVHATERDLMAAVAALRGSGGETAGSPCP